MWGEQGEQERFFVREISISIHGDSCDVSRNVKSCHCLMTYPKRKENVCVKRGLFELSLTDTIGQPNRPLGAAPGKRNDRVGRDQFHNSVFYFCRDRNVVTRGANHLSGLKVERVQREETTFNQFAEGAKDGRRKITQTFGAVDAFQTAH